VCVRVCAFKLTCDIGLIEKYLVGYQDAWKDGWIEKWMIEVMDGWMRLFTFSTTLYIYIYIYISLSTTICGMDMY